MQTHILHTQSLQAHILHTQSLHTHSLHRYILHRDILHTHSLHRYNLHSHVLRTASGAAGRHMQKCVSPGLCGSRARCAITETNANDENA